MSQPLKELYLSHSSRGLFDLCTELRGLASHHMAAGGRVLTAWEETLMLGMNCGGHKRKRALVGRRTKRPPEEESVPQHLTQQPTLKLGLNLVSQFPGR